jgi:integrase
MAVKKRTWKNRDGSIGAAWQAGYSDQSGKWRTRSFDKRKDAETFFDNAKRQVRNGVHVTDADSVTVAEAAKQWLDRLELEGRDRSTLRQYDNHIRNHILPAIGQFLLTKLNRAAVTGFRDHLLKSNSRAMARKIFVSFKAIMTEAESRGSIGHNPASSVEIATDVRGQADALHNREFPQPNEIRALIEAATGKIKVFLTTAAFTGLRSSELRGLHWSNVDFAGHRIHVRQRADEFGTIGPCKTKASYRSVPMAPEVESALREWRVACPRRNGELVLVFPHSGGKPEPHTVLLSRGFHPVQIEAGVVDESGEPKYGLHDLRHFFASWLINELRCNPKKVQSLLGHSSIQVTFDVYGHLFANDDDQDAFAAGVTAIMGC